MIRPASALAALLVSVAVAGCGGGSGSNPPNELGADLGVAVRLADCDDWNQGTVAERLATIGEIRDFAGGPVGSSELKNGPTLDDHKAYEVFKGYCKNGFAHGFKLYKLYTRAAAFASIQASLPPGQAPGSDKTPLADPSNPQPSQ